MIVFVEDVRSYRRPAFLFLIFTFWISCIPATAQENSIGERKPVMTREARKRSFDVKHIAIDLRFDWKKKQALGTTSITIAPLSETDTIHLDAAMLTIDSVAVNGRSVGFEYAGGDKNDNLKIVLDRIYKPTENVTIRIGYQTNWVNEVDPNNLNGTNGKGLRFSRPTSNDPMRSWQIWSFGDPESNRYWFPAYDAPDDLRTTEFTATVDKKLTVVSNGTIAGTNDNPDGTRTFHYKADVPYANHLTAFVVGEFVNVKKNFDGIELNNFGSHREKDWIDASTVRLPDMLRFFSDKLGVKFPYASYSQVFVHDIGTFSGNTGFSTITENMVDDLGTHADYFYLWDLTEAEALAQQWFGGLLTITDWSEVWLNKSLAHNLNGLYNEHKNGGQEFLQWQHSYDQSVYMADWSAGVRHPIVTRDYVDAAAFTGDNYATTRGSLVLHMLRKHVGDQVWWKAIQLYMRSHVNRPVTTAEFQKAFERTSGEQLDWFFEQWVYKMGHPVFAVTKDFDADKKLLTITVKQTQKISPAEKLTQTEFFQGNIGIEIDGRVEQVRLQPKEDNTFTFRADREPKLVHFDFESTWIAEVIFQKSFDELLYQFRNSKDILARHSALTELATLVKSETMPTESKQEFRRALLETISGNSHWRLRMASVSQLQAFATPIDNVSTAALLRVIKNEQSWLKATAVGALGSTADARFADVYISLLNDRSDRVIAAAATALGKTKSPKAVDALATLVNKPSMKSQSLLSALGGLKALNDPRGFDIAFKALSDPNLPRWRLPTGSVWDYRVLAAGNIAALGRGDQAFPLIFERFKSSMAENDLDGTFNNAALIAILAVPRGQEAFDLLRAKYKDEANAMLAIDQYEKQFKEGLKK